MKSSEVGDQRSLFALTAVLVLTVAALLADMQRTQIRALAGDEFSTRRTS